MKALFNIMRLRAWKVSLLTVNIHVCYLAIFYLLLITNFSRNIGDVLLLLIVVSLYLSYMFLINDYCDMQYDKIVGKKKPIYELREWQIIGLLVLITFINFGLVLFVIHDIVFTFVFLIAYFLATFYSAPPIRFKDRGLIGFICDSTMEKPLLILLIFSFFAHFEIDTLLFIILVDTVQFYTVIKHQIDDYENDILTETNTFVVSIGKDQAEKILNKYFYPLNVISIFLFYMIVLIRIPSVSMLLSIVVLNVLGYLVSCALRLEDVTSFIGTFPARSREITYLNVSFQSILIFVLALKCTIESFQYILLLLLFITSQYYLAKSYFYLFKKHCFKPLNEKTCKKYFKTPGTVSSWWDPGSISISWFKELGLKQEHIIRDISPEGKIILDAGTGKGRFAINFALTGAKKVISLDLSEEMIKIARDRAKASGVENRIEFIVGDVENPSFRDNVFDVTCCMATFVHLPNPQMAMNELARVTKPGGLIIADVTSNKILWKIRYRYFPRGFDGIWKSLSKKSFASFFKNANLKIIDAVSLGPRYSPVLYIILASKPVQLQRHTH